MTIDRPQLPPHTATPAAVAPATVVSSTVELPTGTVADGAGDRFVVELTAAGNGPPWPIRMRKWLKEAGRSHGLVCTGAAAVSDRPTGHRPATNAAPGHWKPTGRAVRRAAGGPWAVPAATDAPRVGPDG